LGPEARLRLFIDVCHAIQHAHHKGVIHRDIKPSNVLVTLHDGAPMVKVIDFGVAKAIVHKLTERTLFTAFGQMIGTPAYMSPEQADMSGLDIDTRSDVYSLGVLLYELLTGTTPLETRQLREAGYAEIQRLIREEEPQRPSTRLSSLGDTATLMAGNRGLEVKNLVQLLSGDLDWVVMKALDKDRDRRYATPGSFAEDIERYLRDDAIVARPPSPAYKLKKFVRRNRVAVLTIASAAAALLIGSALATWQAVRATVAQREARAATAQAEENFRQARAAVDEYFTMVSENKLLDVPGLQPLRKELLESARKYYESFLKQRGEDPAIRAEAAATYYRLAMLTQLIGSKDDAVAHFNKAIDLYGELAHAHSDQPRFQSDLAICYNDLSNLYRISGRTSEAVTIQQKALVIRERLARDRRSGARYKNELAKSYGNLGVLHNEAGRVADALEASRQAREINARLAADLHPDLEFASDLGKHYNSPSTFRIDLALNLLSMSYAQFGLGRFDDALKSREAAREVIELLARERPSDPEVQQLRANCYADIAVLLSQTGRPADALDVLHDARQILEELIRANPEVSNYQKQLAATYNNIGAQLSQMSRTDEAMPNFDKARVILDRLATDHPSITWFRYLLADSYRQAAFELDRAGHSAEGIQRYEQARTILQQLVSEDPNVVDFRSLLASTHADLGYRFTRDGRHADALAAHQKAQVILESLVAEKPDVTSLQNLLAGTYNHIGRHMRETSRSEDAMNYYLKALAILKELAGGHPNAVYYQNTLTYTQRGLARVSAQLGRTDEAINWLDQAIAIDQRYAETFPLSRYNLACDLALGVPLVGGPDAANGTQGHERADQAMDALRSAITQGYPAAHIASDPDFEALRGREDFKTLVATLQAAKSAVKNQ
jgi:serine/threonine protein kinase